MSFKPTGPRTTWSPRGLYRATKDQLGSIRGIYLRDNSIDAKQDLHDFDQHVILLNGFFQTRHIFEKLEASLRRDGYGCMSVNQGGLLGRYNHRPIDDLVDLLEQKIETLRTKFGVDRFHLLGHSKGGLVARRWLLGTRDPARCKSLVTLGTPHQGTPSAWFGFASGLSFVSTNPRELRPHSQLVREMREEPTPASVPFANVFSTSDLVSPASACRLSEDPRAETIEVRGIGHSELCWDPMVYGIIRAWLDRASSTTSPATPNEETP